MRLWNGNIDKLYEADKCKGCLYPATCALLYIIKEHSKESAKRNDDYLEIIISKCPEWDIQK